MKIMYSLCAALFCLTGIVGSSNNMFWAICMACTPLWIIASQLQEIIEKK